MPAPPADLPIRNIAVEMIRPGAFQARRYFDPAALRELVESVQVSGVISPVVVRTRTPGYELLAGERRWRAAQLAGLHEVPAIVRDDLGDREALVLGLIENLQRESLTPIETAAGFRQLSELFELTHEQVGDRVGKSREYVTNYLRLLNIEAPVQALVNEGHLSLGHAKVLAGQDAAGQRHWAAVTVDHGLSVRALERRIGAARRGTHGSGRSGTGDLAALERRLADQLGYPVKVKADARGRGDLRLTFHSLDELDGLLSRIGCDPE